jgi:hypothetical protein
MQNFPTNDHPLSDRRQGRRSLLLGGLGLIGLGLLPDAAGTAAADPKASSKVQVSPPPTDVNDLSMEVNALRTLYLLKAGPDQQGERSEIGGYDAGQYPPSLMCKECAQSPRKREPADASKNYVKVLTELRAAFIAGQEDRINELSEELDELARTEEPDIDDTIEVTESARKNAIVRLQAFPPTKLAAYLGAYGKEFPDPWLLMFQTMRLNGKGTKPSPEQWKETCDFVVKEVSWQVGGVDLGKQKAIGTEAASMLAKAYTLDNETLKKNGAPGGELRNRLNALVKQASATDPLKHVLEQDFAELLSNPRLLPAIEARLDYLKKVNR